MLTLTTWLRQCFVRFLQCKVIISVFVPFTLHSLESSHTVYSPHLWSRKLGSPSLGGVLKVLKEKKLFWPLFASQVQWVSPFSFLPPCRTVNWGVGIYLSWQMIILCCRSVTWMLNLRITLLSASPKQWSWERWHKSTCSESCNSGNPEGEDEGGVATYQKWSRRKWMKNWAA